jgi:hypothetical protein
MSYWYSSADSATTVDELERALFRREREPAFDSKFTTFSP